MFNKPEQTNNNAENVQIIKAKPLTIKKQPFSEQPKLRTLNSYSKLNGVSLNNRRIEMPPAFHFPELTNDKAGEPPQENPTKETPKSVDVTDRATTEEPDVKDDKPPTTENVVRRYFLNY